MTELAALIADMDPTVRLGLVIGVALCLTGAVIVGLMARAAYLRRHRRKAHRAKALAPTVVYRDFQLADMVRHEQTRVEGYAEQPWWSWETEADRRNPEQQTQVLHFDSAERRQPR
jgi:7-keto-8-aminopelargonate synthetase-like enzyme